LVPALHTIDYITITAIVLLGVIISSKFRTSSGGDQARIDGIERKVEQLTAAVTSLQGRSRDDGTGMIATVPVSKSYLVSSGSLSPGVRALADQGRKLEAIKLLREESGLGLKEAKDAVDDYERGTRR
jgi:large subunit ribosomal protein L7/L12